MVSTRKGCNMRVLVTGAGGFAGSFLVERLVEESYKVHGVLSPRNDRSNLRSVEDCVQLYPTDLCDETAVLDLLKRVQPEGIFQLASMAEPSRSFGQVRDVLRANALIVVNLFEALRTLQMRPRILLTSSSEVYGGKADAPITEDDEILPVNPYGVSKYNQEVLCSYYERTCGIPAIRARPFTHTGPRQKDLFAVPSFAHQVARIEAGRQEPILMVGNLEAVRDYSDVRDIVRGYVLLFQKGNAGDVYNLCSGRGVTLRDITDLLLSQSPMPIRVEVDPARFRPIDVPRIVGNPAKASQATDWHIETPLTKTLTDTLEYWRLSVSQEKKGQ